MAVESHMDGVLAGSAWLARERVRPKRVEPLREELMRSIGGDEAGEEGA